VREFSSSVLTCLFLDDPPRPEISTLSLHDALPISHEGYQRRPVHEGRGVGDRGEHAELRGAERRAGGERDVAPPDVLALVADVRSEEHTSELQSLAYLVCRLLLEKKKNKKEIHEGR